MGTSGQYYVYLLTNQTGTVLYAGVANDLIRRVHEHKSKLTPGFTAKYGVDRLVYYEVHDEIYPALAREKQIKAGPRRKKLELINSLNPEWRDLYLEIAG